MDQQTDFAPLAARMRPQSLDEYTGQQHILGPGKALRRAVERGQCHSLILWGPPGTGKTTLAELIAHYANARVERMSAVTSGVKDIRAAIEQAKQSARIAGQRTLLFVDEVHRFNKSQQDAFLPHIEDGTVTFIGATTENPSFELNGALLSRARVYLLKKLQPDDLQGLLSRALTDSERGVGQLNVSMDESCRELLCQAADGDARRLLNFLELLVDMAPEEAQSDGSCQRLISPELLRELLGERMAAYDKGGDHYYDMISAVHKSVRGSSPDGALYWYARIVHSGGDPLQVARRLLAIATEDIGNADPRALQLALNAWDTFTRVGPAEGERAIAQALVYCACAPKSNALYQAWNTARQQVASEPDYPVPLHLRNAPTSLMKSLGHGEGYRYAHNEPGAYAAGESYLPPELDGRRFYQPTDRGLEKKIGDKLDYLAELDRNSPVQRK